MKGKEPYEYHDRLVMEIEVILTGTALEVEKYRDSMLAIKHTLDCVRITRAKVISKASRKDHKA